MSTLEFSLSSHKTILGFIKRNGIDLIFNLFPSKCQIRKSLGLFQRQLNLRVLLQTKRFPTAMIHWSLVLHWDADTSLGLQWSPKLYKLEKFQVHILSYTASYYGFQKSPYRDRKLPQHERRLQNFKTHQYHSLLI